jgi:dTDP-4-dehydrorhamnose reductase
MTVLVFGKDGQVGAALAQHPNVCAVGRTVADLRFPQSCAEIITALRPKAVINAAAFTAVDRAENFAEAPPEASPEDCPDIARRVNTEAPRAMAEACARQSIPFLQLSTDYVFDGHGDRPWRPDDPVAPINHYGVTKAAGEAAVREAGGCAVILRTSWVFARGGDNFVSSVVAQAATQSQLTVVDDQVGGPTPAESLAAACLTIVARLIDAPELAGTYHYSGGPDVSRSDWAREILRVIDASTEVVGVNTSAVASRARRPLNSRLDCTRTEQVFSLQRPDWRATLADDVADVTRQLGTKDGRTGGTEGGIEGGIEGGVESGTQGEIQAELKQAVLNTAHSADTVAVTGLGSRERSR